MPDFASFKSTYKSLPLETINETGRILQEKYFKNRDTADKLQSSLNNLNVHSKDKPIVTQVIADTNNELNNLNGEYEKADNVIRNIVQRIDKDDVLKTAVQDKTNYDVTLKTLQEKSLDPKSGITNEAIQAFVIHSNISKKGTIYKDENGIIQNRLTVEPPPIKIDPTDTILKITEQLTKNPDIIERTYPGVSAQIAGYLGVTKETLKGVNPIKIQSAVASWINTQPEIKNYYDYINSAKVIQKFGNEPVPLDRMLQDFNLYIRGDGSTYQLSKDEKGGITEIDTNLSNIAQYLIQNSDSGNGFDQNKYNLLSKQMYISLATARDLGQISEMGNIFGFSQSTSDTKYMENWVARVDYEHRKQNEQITDLVYKNTRVMPNTDISVNDYNIKVQKSKQDLDKARTALSITDPILKEEAKAKYAIAKQTYERDNFIYHNYINGALDQSPQLRANLENTYQNFIKKIEIPSGANKDDYVPSFDKFVNWLRGNEELGTYKQVYPNKIKDLNTFISNAKAPFSLQAAKDISLTDVYYALDDIKETFLNDVSKYIKTNGLQGGYGRAVSFEGVDKNGTPINSTINQLISDQIWKNSTAYETVGSANDSDSKMLDTWLNENKINFKDWDLTTNTYESNMHLIGAHDLTFTNKVDGTVKNIVVTQDPRNAIENSLTQAERILSMSTSPQVNDFAINQVAFASYYDSFSNLFDEEKLVQKTQTETDIYNIPLRKADNSIEGGTLHIRKEGNKYVGYPIINGIISNSPYGDGGLGATGKTVTELINNITKIVYFPQYYGRTK